MRPSAAGTNRGQRMQKVPIDTTIRRYSRDATPMSTAVKLDDALVVSARIHGEASHRSTSKQIEYWATLGRLAEQNPDLSYEIIVGILRARAQAKAGEVSAYKFG